VGVQTRSAKTRRGTARRNSTWIPPRFSSSYLSFCWLAAAAGTAGAAGIKQLYQTEVESWRSCKSQNIEFTMKRLREPIPGRRLNMKEAAN
jgi:hypothetical protein